MDPPLEVVDLKARLAIGPARSQHLCHVVAWRRLCRRNVRVPQHWHWAVRAVHWPRLYREAAVIKEEARAQRGQCHIVERRVRMLRHDKYVVVDHDEAFGEGRNARDGELGRLAVGHVERLSDAQIQAIPRASESRSNRRFVRARR